MKRRLTRSSSKAAIKPKRKKNEPEGEELISSVLELFRRSTGMPHPASEYGKMVEFEFHSDRSLVEDIVVTSEWQGVGVEIEYANQDVQPLAQLPLNIWKNICFYLSDVDRWSFAGVCKRTNYLINSFVGLNTQLLLIPSSDFKSKTFLARRATISSHTIIHCDPSWDRPAPFGMVLQAKLLREALRRGDDFELDTQKALISHLESLASHNLDSMHWEEPNHGVMSSLVPRNPEGLKIRLYEYQAFNVSWMMRIEQAVSDEQGFRYSPFIRLPWDLPFFIDAARRTVRLISDTEPRYPHRHWFTTKGGILADEMGLGKTMTVLALVLSNPRPKRENGRFIRHISRRFLFFATGATLVVCPPHLVKQWKTEIETHSDLICLSVPSVTQHKQITYQMVIEADIVIVSEKLLFSSEIYRSTLHSRTGKSSNPALHQTGKPELNRAQPVFELFEWHRIVKDEAHEISNPMDGFESSYRWYVTGTPLPNGWRSLVNAAEFLQIKCDTKEIPDMEYWHATVVSQALHRTIFRRNNKATVDKEVVLPSLNESYELTPLSRLEQTLYDVLAMDGQEQELRRFIQRPPPSSFDDPLFLREHMNNAFSRAHAAIQRYERYCRELQWMNVELQEATIPSEKKKMRDTIKNRENCIQKTGEDLANCLKKMAAFSRLFYGDERLSECNGCHLQAYARLKLSCDHMVCEDCTVLSVEHRQCTVCEQALEGSSIVLPRFELPQKDGKVVLSPAEDGSVPDPEFHLLQMIHGTKFAAAIRYLMEYMQRDEEVKMIIFSQDEEHFPNYPAFS